MKKNMWGWNDVHRVYSRSVSAQKVGDHEKSIRYAKRSVQLRKDSSFYNSWYGLRLYYTGEQEKGLGFLQKAAELNPDSIAIPSLIERLKSKMS